MQIKSKVVLLFAAMLVVANLANAVVTINSAGAFGYSYNTASGPIPAEADNHGLVIQSGVPGLANTAVNTPQDITWHFVLAPGLSFGRDFVVEAGGLAQDGILTGEYSTTGLAGSYKTFFTNNREGDKPCVSLSIPDIAGATNVYVKFTAMTTDLAGRTTAFFWGDHPTDRNFILKGTIPVEVVRFPGLGLEEKVAKILELMTLEEKSAMCLVWCPVNNID